MKNPYFLLIVVVIIIITAGVLGFWPEAGKIKVPISETAQPVLVGNDRDVQATSSEVIISQPPENQKVASPFTVSGQAKGNWFFEATLPIKLEDRSGGLIASAQARAQSDWETDKLVPFSATLSFTTTATSGYLVISKDNPSGLPQNAASVKIPINF
jgi:hypothetical protein